jgi:hypothetical protein
MLAFLLFSVIFSFIYYLHFHIALATYKRMRGETSKELDTGYVRLEDYFAQSFRTKMSAWLKLPKDPASSPDLAVIDKGGEKIYIARDARYPDSHEESEMVVVDGDFQCGAECSFEKELLIRQDCVVGPSTQLQALAVNGMTRLNPGTKVRRWVDSTGFLDIRGNCKISSRVTSRSSIRFGPGAQAQSLFAPEVTTQGRREDTSKWTANGHRVVQLPVPANEQKIEGFDPAKMKYQGGDCYRYDGDLRLDAAVHLSKPLIVRGDFLCASSSYIEADMKVAGTAFIGDASIVKSNIVAQGDLTLGHAVFFQGILYSGGTMRLRHGVRGLREGLPVAAYSSGPLLVESNCVINGKLSSGKFVQAVVTPVDWFETEKWKST